MFVFVLELCYSISVFTIKVDTVFTPSSMIYDVTYYLLFSFDKKCVIWKFIDFFAFVKKFTKWQRQLRWINVCGSRTRKMFCCWISEECSLVYHWNILKRFSHVRQMSWFVQLFHISILFSVIFSTLRGKKIIWTSRH